MLIILNVISVSSILIILHVEKMSSKIRIILDTQTSSSKFCTIFYVKKRKVKVNVK